MTRLDKDGPSVCMTEAWISKLSLMALVCDVRDGRFRLGEFSEYDAKVFEAAAKAIREHLGEQPTKGRWQVKPDGKCEWMTGAFKPCETMKAMNDAGSFNIVTYQTPGDDAIVYLGVSSNGRAISYCPFCGASVEAPAVRQLDESE